MHYASWGETRLREVDELIASTDAMLVGGAIPDWTAYQKMLSRRTALLEVRGLLAEALGL